MNALLARASEMSELFHYAPLVFLFFLTLNEFLCSSTFCVLSSALGDFFPRSIFHLLSPVAQQMCKKKEKEKQEGLRRKAEHCCPTQALLVKG